MCAIAPGTSRAANVRRLTCAYMPFVPRSPHALSSMAQSLCVYALLGCKVRNLFSSAIALLGLCSLKSATRGLKPQCFIAQGYTVMKTWTNVTARRRVLTVASVATRTAASTVTVRLATKESRVCPRQPMPR
jgi:hypothetical protein